MLARLFGTRWLVVFFAFALASSAAFSRPFDGAPLAVTQLPVEARETLSHIERGGPYGYDRDGAVFRNYERQLPPRQRGYYREYTVRTPGVRHRGARRLIVGCERGNAGSGRASAASRYPECAGPPDVYYTEDHYRTFRRVAP